MEGGRSDATALRGKRKVVQPRVFVLDRRQQPLMPCHPARARQLLRNGRARVHRLHPFTIRLSDRSAGGSQVDGVVVKLDPGSRCTGISVARIDADGTVHGLVAIEVKHRGEAIHRRMVARAQLRRGRRSRKLRYRAPRFDNRRRPKGWLAPSLRHRVDNAETWVVRLSKLAPVTGLAVELVRFDTQLLQNPKIGGVEYQHGTLAGYELREYLLEKFKRKCVYCGAGVGPDSVPLNVEHVRPKAGGGTNRVSNLVIACVPCNDKKSNRPVEEFLAQDPERLAIVLRQLKAPLKGAAAVNATRWALYEALRRTGLPVVTGTGGETKWNRARLGIPKSHTLDALCVGDVNRVGSYPDWVVLASAGGRGSYQRAQPDKYGMTRAHYGRPGDKRSAGHKTRVKQVQGFKTGDYVRADLRGGKSAGTHRGRLTVRARGTFMIVTSTGTVDGAHHRNVTLLSRADGWSYTSAREASTGDVPLS